MFKYVIKVSGLDRLELDRLDHLLSLLGVVGENGIYYIRSDKLLSEAIELLEINRVKFGVYNMRMWRRYNRLRPRPDIR